MLTGIDIGVKIGVPIFMESFIIAKLLTLPQVLKENKSACCHSPDEHFWPLQSLPDVLVMESGASLKHSQDAFT